MSFFNAGAASANNVKPAYTGLEIQTSVNTLPIPVVWGQNRLAPNLIWYGNFQSLQNQSAGKGGESSSSYTYTADVMMALCEGPISGVATIWVDRTTTTDFAALGLTLFTGGASQAAWGYLQTAVPSQALAYQSTAYVAGQGYKLGASPDLPNYNYLVNGVLWASGFNAFDADAALVVQDFLTNTQYGVPGFPAGSINLGTLLSSGLAATTGDAAYQTYCRAMGLAISPCLTGQEKAQSVLARWLQLTNTAAVWSATQLKLIPYGDAAVTGHGVTYLPNLTPIYDLDDDDLVDGGSDDPVQVTRSDPTDAYNIVRLEAVDSTNEFAPTPVEARDQNAIELYGMRVASTVTAHEITDVAGIAPLVAQLILQRGLYIRNTYSFKLSWEYCLLEPMDLVTLTDARLGLEATTIRIVSIEEDDEGELTVTAEEFPAGTASATLYPKQGKLPYAINQGIAAAAVNPPIIFEPPLALTNGIQQVWMLASGGVSGAVDPNWGGCNVWLSTDGVTYAEIGTILNVGRQGLLTAGFAAPPGGNPDTTNTLSVSLAESGGQLLSGTDADAAAGQTLCYVDGELIGYMTSTLTAAIASGEAQTIPAAAPYEVGVAHAASFVADLGVVHAVGGAPFTVIGSAPSAGQYTVNATTGAYGFAAADAGVAVKISYQYGQAGHYAISHIYRGLYGTAPAAHASGTQFGRLDNATFKFDLPAAYVGATLKVKLQSFNVWGQGLQDISICTVYSFVPGGAATPSITAGAGAGTGPSLAVTGTEAAGTIILTTGTAPATGAAIATLGLSPAFGVAPVPAITPGNAAAASLSGAAAVVPSTSASSLVLTAGATALAASTAYVWYYSLT